MKKWIAGIVAAIITGIVVSWLTQEGGPINPVEPTATLLPAVPHVLITEFEVGVVVLPRDSVINATFAVYNEGETTARECSLWWHSHGANFAPSGTQLFSLTPKETKNLTVQSFIYKESGTYDSFAYVECSNFRSEDVHRNVAVIHLE